MIKNYVYRMDHDTGFAPNTEYRICTLCGCKKTTIEKWAKIDSWVIGIGGNNTCNPNKLIYAMKDERNLSYPEFRKQFPDKSKYLKPKNAGKSVLVSTKFYYFGKNAKDLPNKLNKLIIYRQGCKCVSDEDVSKLKKHINKYWCKNYGVYGKPCNVDLSTKGKNVSAA